MYYNMDEPYVSNKTLDDMPEQRRNYNKNRRRKIMIEVIFYGMLFFFLLYLIPIHVAERIVVTGNSMENALYDGESVLIEKISVASSMIERYDIIVFEPMLESEDDYYVKRVIGIPGDTVQIIAGNIYIDGTIIDDKYAKDGIMTEAGLASEPILLTSGQYFVLGDNREVSSDSRSRVVGIVNMEQIVGVVKAVIWPLSEFRIVE